MKSVGIDIGTSSIKLVEVVNTGKSVQILSYAEHQLGQNPAHDPELEIHEFLQGLAARYEGTQTNVVMAVRQERVSVRQKSFPFTDRLKIVKSLPFELEEDLPFSSDTAVYEARTFRIQGPQSDVLAAVVPKHRIIELIEKYQTAGLTLTILSAEGFALANCFEPWWEPVRNNPPAVPVDIEATAITIPRKLNLIIQIGHTHTIVGAFEDQRLVGMRSILWGGKLVAEAISRKYEIPYIEAIRELRTKAFILPNKAGASYDQIVFSDTIAGAVRDLGKELKLSILEIETELGGYVQEASVTGGLAGIQSLNPFLTQLIEIPVNTASILDSYIVNFEKTATVDHVIGTALGLALEGQRKPRNPPIQFLRGEFARQNESLQIFWQTWAKSIQVAVALVAVFFIFSFVRESLTESLLEDTTSLINDQAKKIAHLPAKMANETGVKKYIRDKRKHAQDMKAIEGLSHMNSALEILRKISEAAPARGQTGLVVSLLRIEDQNVFVQGTVSNVQDKTQLEKALTPLAKDGRITPHAATAPPGVLGMAFADSFVVDRGIQKTEGER